MKTSTLERASTRMPDTETIRRRMAAIQKSWSALEKVNRIEEARVLQLRLLNRRSSSLAE